MITLKYRLIILVFLVTLNSFRQTGTNKCLVTTINSSFEQPSIGSAPLDFKLDSEVPGWKTTASDHIIEIWSNTFKRFLAFCFLAA